MAGPITRALTFALNSGIMWETLPRWWRRVLVLTFPVSIPLALVVVLVLLYPAIFEIVFIQLVGIMRDAWREE